MVDATPRVLAVVVADSETAAIGTRSRLGERWGDHTVLQEVLTRLAQVRGVNEIALLLPEPQLPQAQGLQSLGLRIPLTITALTPRSAALAARVRIGRAWNLLAWRGGAGQWAAFDEEYHPNAIATAATQSFDGQGAQHVLIVHSHAVFLDVEITSALVHHHFYKNHEMRMTYTPAAPGLSGMVLQADIVHEMGQKSAIPSQLLAYDPKAPTFDTLIREACMQVDPALSKVPNRFCVDTQRSWDICQALHARGPAAFASTAELCLAAALTVAPGITDLSRTHPWPREVELELTPQRLTRPIGYADSALPPLDTHHWLNWLATQKFCDDLLVTLGGLGDPLLAPADLREILHALRTAGALSICVQTDLAGGNVDGLLHAVSAGNVDVITVTFYGHTAATYAKVAGADLHAAVMHNMQRLADAIRARGGGGGIPLVIPRLLKVRDTIPEMEPFFDFWMDTCGWAVIEGPTDRAGTILFGAVVDMAPPKRKACRRIWDRMLIRADGRAGACDQDVANLLSVGSIESMSIQQMWNALQNLRNKHAAAKWNDIDPCKSCREWHRP